MTWAPAAQRVLLVLGVALFVSGVLFAGRSARSPFAVPAPDDPALEVRLDVNAATAAELETLPGVGAALACRIVAYRSEHGPFRSVEDLRRIPGFGDKLVAALRTYLRAARPQLKPSAPSWSSGTPALP